MRDVLNKNISTFYQKVDITAKKDELTQCV